MEKYSRLEATLILQRQPQFYIFRIYLPWWGNTFNLSIKYTFAMSSSLFVFISWIGLFVFLEGEQLNVRMQLQVDYLRMALHVITLLTLFGVGVGVSFPLNKPFSS